MMAIETRRDLARHLQGQMAASRGGWSASEADEDAGRTMVKTYLVEAHGADSDDATLAKMGGLGKKIGFDFAAAGESGLFRLQKKDVTFWCDTSTPRFWRLYTTALVKDADDARDAIVSSAPWLDRVWIPPHYLETLADTVGAQMLTFSLSHDRRPVTEGDRPVTDSDFVTLRLWASNAQKTLHKLRTAHVFPHAVSVRSVRLRSGGDDAQADYCVAEYFHDGKITAGGTSFDEHNRVIVRMLRDYGDLVRSFEERYGIGATTDASGRHVVAGQPVVLDLKWTVQDLEYAVQRIFAANDPFRLWGLPTRVSDGHFRARAVDLHVGGVLTFDITQENVVIQLPRGVCGNTVVRFLNNLQFHVNADARAEAG
ncbi:MAG TPA: hypothetical protein VGG39_06075 [Polyangiaceae bacterium]|jgi:hypothetical protein